MGEVLKGKNAVVTGAGRGIGKAVALALAEEGSNVVVCDLGGQVDGTGAESSPADEVVQECKGMGVKAVANYSDVSDFKAAEGIIKSCVDNFGRIDILVNIAGIDKPRMIWNMTEEDWDQALAVHLKGTFNLSRHACVLMREQRYGRIINTISDAWMGTIGHVNYGAAKAGIGGLTYATAREMGVYGVTCNAFAPFAATRMVLSDGVKDGMKKRLEKGLITQERYDEMLNMATAEYVPPVIIYLASDAAANVNGCIFGCGGGKVTYWTPATETRGIFKDYETMGKWTQEELIKLVPKNLLVNYVNPAPAQPEKKAA